MALCPDDAVNNLFMSSTQSEVTEQYNVSPTFLSLRDLSVYNVDACVARSVFDNTLFDSSRQLLTTVLDSINAVNTAKYVFIWYISGFCLTLCGLFISTEQPSLTSII